MRITHCGSYAGLSAQAATLVAAEIERKPDLLLCAATGQSPAGTYEALADRAARDRGLFARLRIVKLDEWGGLGPEDRGSCEAYLRERVLGPLRIPPDRYLGFDATAPDPDAECARVRAALERQGPIDVCMLGLGKNGHIGFNEPGSTLIPHCHVAHLTEQTRHHAMVRSTLHPPDFGLTLGPREILASRRILLLVAGEEKREAAARLLTGEVSTALPASLLWLHGNVDCLVDRAAPAAE